MTGDVGHCLGGDDVRGDLHRRGQAVDAAVSPELKGAPTATSSVEPIGVEADGLDKTNFFDHGRGESMDEPAGVGHQLAGFALDRCQERRRRRGGIQEVGDRFKLHDDAHQGGSQTVVQVAAQTAPLLLDGLQQPGPGPLQLGRQEHGLGGDGGLGGDIVEQSARRAIERGARTFLHLQQSHPVALENEWQGQGRSDDISGAATERTVRIIDAERDPCAAQPHCSHDGTSDRVEDVGARRRGQAAGQLGHGAGWIVPASEQEPVGDALEPATESVEGDGDDS